MNSQKFTLHIELINTKSHCGRLQLSSNTPSSPVSLSCYSRGLTLYTSTELSSRGSLVVLDLRGNERVETIRIGLTGGEIHQMNNYVQQLNFSKVFNYTNRTLIPNNQLSIGLQLTKTINITEGLTDSDVTMYSGLWLPTFGFNLEELFEETRHLPATHTELALGFSETAFFIKNKQKPMARSSEIIFSTILFICMCLDLVCMMFLLMRLWFRPIMKLVISRLFASSSWLNRFVSKKKPCTSTDIDELTEKMKSFTNEMQQHLDALAEKINVLVDKPTSEGKFG